MVRWVLATATNVDLLSTQLKTVLIRQQVMQVSKHRQYLFFVLWTSHFLFGDCFLTACEIWSHVPFNNKLFEIPLMYLWNMVLSFYFLDLGLAVGMALLH